MITTSHFVGIELKNEIFSDLFVNIFSYLKENNIENILNFQNPLSMHITMYYFENNLDFEIINKIKTKINSFDINKDIYLLGFDYFYRNNDKFCLHLTSKSDINFNYINNDFSKNFNRTNIEENNFAFSPHINIFKILNVGVYEIHKENIERIISKELEKLANININNKNMFLYAVNSKFKDEIQIKI